MVRYRTNKEVELFDKRGQSLGGHILKLIISRVEFTEREVTATGYYYYGDGQILDAFKVVKSREFVEAVEPNLGELTDAIFGAVTQRATEFGFAVLGEESGENWGTTIEDWEIDND